jgi:hypothetical protein
MRRGAKAAEYVSRDWSCFDAAAADHLRSLGARGAASVLALGDALRRHAVAVQPGWPSEQERARDLDHHRVLAELLGRVPSRGR